MKIRDEGFVRTGLARAEPALLAKAAGINRASTAASILSVLILAWAIVFTCFKIQAPVPVAGP